MARQEVSKRVALSAVAPRARTSSSARGGYSVPALRTSHLVLAQRFTLCLADPQSLSFSFCPSLSPRSYIKTFMINQPVASPLAYIAHMTIPDWFWTVSLAIMWIVEIPLPFLAFLPGWPRMIAAIGIVKLMLGIWAGGNYGFFNLLTGEFTKRRCRCLCCIEHAYACVPVEEAATLRPLPSRRASTAFMTCVHCLHDVRPLPS